MLHVYVYTGNCTAAESDAWHGLGADRFNGCLMYISLVFLINALSSHFLMLTISLRYLSYLF